MKLGIKTLAAAAAAGLMLFLASAPAGAVSVGFDITDGELQTSVGNFELDGTAPGPCTNLGANALTTDITGPDGSGNYASSISALTIDSSLNAGSPAAPYLVEIRKDTTGNTGTIFANATVNHNLRVVVNIYATTGAPTCVKGAQVCRVRATFAGPATDLEGTASTVPPTSTGNTVSLSGAGSVTAVLGQSCNPPFASLINSTVTIPAGDPLVLTAL